MAFEIRPYHEIPNDELYRIKNLLVIYRGVPRADGWRGTLDYEPITINKRGWLRYLLPVLINDARDIPGAKFHWHDIRNASSYTLDYVKQRMKESDEIELYIFRLKNKTTWV